MNLPIGGDGSERPKEMFQCKLKDDDGIGDCSLGDDGQSCCGWPAMNDDTLGCNNSLR